MDSSFIEHWTRELNNHIESCGVYHPDVGEIWNILGLFHHHVSGDQEESLRCHTKALDAYTRALDNDTSSTSHTKENINASIQFLDSLSKEERILIAKEALVSIEERNKIIRRASDPHSHHRCSSDCRGRGTDWKSKCDENHKALCFSVAITYSDIGNVHCKRNEIHLAKEAYEKAIVTFRTRCHIAFGDSLHNSTIRRIELIDPNSHLLCQKNKIDRNKLSTTLSLPKVQGLQSSVVSTTNQSEEKKNTSNRNEIWKHKSAPPTSDEQENIVYIESRKKKNPNLTKSSGSYLDWRSA